MTVLSDHAPLGPNDLEALIPASLFARLSARVARETAADRDVAEHVVRATLAFLVACARNPGTPLTPSRTVDAGWHAFVLHTREYADFCQRVAGCFIHHAPEEDDEEEEQRSDAASRVERTVAIMRRSGLPVDEELWSTQRGSCSSQCQNCCSDHAGTNN
jgi:hypothetical protein